jgi:tetratricopeptide (TPR) repeat protein
MEDIENLSIVCIGLTPEEFQSTCVFTKQFDSVDSCKHYLSSLKANDRIYLVMTTNDKADILKIINNSQIIAIYLFKTTLNITHTKIYGCFDESSSLSTKLHNDVRFHYRNFASPWNIFDCPTKQTSLNELSIDNVSFVWSQILLDILYKLPTSDDKQAKDEWLAECRRAYSNDPIQIEQINKFEREFCSEDAIKWYTHTGFAYRLLNQALRTKKIDVIYKCRFMLRQVYQQLVKVHEKDIKDDLPIETVFRGQEIIAEELEKLCRSSKQLISTNAFLSTSIDNKVSSMFLNSVPLSSNDKHWIQFKITIDPAVSLLYAFAYIGIPGLSTKLIEMEVLFAPGAVFYAETVPIQNKNDHIWRMDLRLARNDQCLEMNRFMEGIRKKHARYPNSLFTLASVLAEIGESSSALLFYRMVIQQLNPNNDLPEHDLQSLFSNIGSLYYNTGNYYEAIRFYEKVLDMICKSVITHAVPFVTVCTHMGQTYLELGRYERARWFFAHALWIVRNLPDQYPDIRAQLYNGVGRLQQYEKNFRDSLKYYTKSYDIINQYAPHEYTFLIDVQLNMGGVYQTCCMYDVAVQQYKKIIALCEKVLPSEKNIPLIKTYSNMSLCYSNREKFDDAEYYIKRSLDLANTLDPINHDIMATCYNVYGIYYESKQQYTQAYEYAKLSMEHATKLKLPDHHPSMEIYKAFLENIRRKKE